MSSPRKVPIATVDKKGRVICPTCDKPIPIPEDSILAPGVGNCQVDGQGHVFAIDEKGAEKANAIISKSSGGSWRKDVLKNFEGLPAGAEPPKDDDGRNFLIG